MLNTFKNIILELQNSCKDIGGTSGVLFTHFLFNVNILHKQNEQLFNQEINSEEVLSSNLMGMLPVFPLISILWSGI